MFYVFETSKGDRRSHPGHLPSEMSVVMNQASWAPMTMLVWAHMAYQSCSLDTTILEPDLRVTCGALSMLGSMTGERAPEGDIKAFHASP